MTRALNIRPHILLIVGLLFFALAACSSTPLQSLPTVTPIPVHDFIPPTEPPAMLTAVAATATARASAASGPALDPVAVERGRERYQALQCGSCHGENGEGTSQGSTLVGLALNEEDFVSFLRSGGSVGSRHQYSTDRLSDRGSRNLYQYLLSLGGS